jgi:hypothetical protein
MLDFNPVDLLSVDIRYQPPWRSPPPHLHHVAVHIVAMIVAMIVAAVENHMHTRTAIHVDLQLAIDAYACMHGRRSAWGGVDVVLRY